MVTNGSSKACASCKYQRRKCTNDCLLAPYFPNDKPRIFRNARRLFGVSNMQKLLKMIEPNRRDKAMETMIYEANMRAEDPVYGCVSLARQYHSKIGFLTQELHYVRMQIAQFKELAQHQNHTKDRELSQQQNHNYEGSGVCESPTNLHRDQADFADIIDYYGFDAVQGKYDYWRLGHGQVNFVADMDDILGDSSVIASDGHHQDSKKSSLSSFALDKKGEVEALKDVSGLR